MNKRCTSLSYTGAMRCEKDATHREEDLKEQTILSDGTRVTCVAHAGRDSREHGRAWYEWNVVENDGSPEAP